ncbi:rhodanese-like domain-containing protein [Nocardioides sp.]|uniref:rhodanese-like domain-containing protein n=1 Tax=Nocardioides sp. TaxID=35761 RepID=UPI002ED615F4
MTVSDLDDPLPDGLSVLDVREQVEWDHGHIDGAQHLPMMELVERRDEIPQGRVLVVCRVGNRSARVTAYLVQQGYDAVNLDGGMVDWAGSGRTMVSETDGRPQVV